MRDKTGAQALFSIMLDYMEKNGDISKPEPGSQGRLDHLQKWLELADLLNKAIDEPRTVEKWRKTWSDFKNNTKKKVKKIQQQGGDGPEITDVEKRLIKLLKKQNNTKRNESDEELQLDEGEEGSLSPHPQHFCAVNGSESLRRKSGESSFTSESSSSQQPPKKRKKYIDYELKEVMDRYFEFEREREKMAHEREMARIKQNNQIINTLGRIVTVLESLSPSIQKILNADNNEAG